MTETSSKRVPIGEMLIAAGVLKQKDLDSALIEQKHKGARLGRVLVEMGLVSEVQLTQMLSNQLSVPWVSLYHVEFSRELLNVLPAEVAERFCAVPVYVREVRGQGSTLFIAMDDPGNDQALAEIRERCGMPVKAMVAPPSDIRNAIRVYYFGGKETPATVQPQPVRAAPVVDLPTKPSEAATRRTEAKPADAAPPKRDAALARRGPRMVTLALLDGTTVTLPARARGGAAGTRPPGEALTAQDLIAALTAGAEGADVSDILPDRRWEPLFGALLSLLLRKGVIADWEFIEEWNARRR